MAKAFRRRGAYVRVDIGVDGVEFLFEEGDMAVDRPDEPLVHGAATAVGLHADHLDNLPTSGDEFAQRPGVRSRHRANLRPDLVGEQRNDLGVDGVGLGELAERLGEAPDLARIDDGERQTGAGERGGHCCGEVAS